MTKFLCKTEEVVSQSVNPLEPPEYGCIVEEIEAPNRNKAKWIFIKKHFGVRGSMKSRGLPKISVTIVKPFLVIEQDPNAELEPCLIDGETYDLICMMKFDSLEKISKFTEILHRCGVPHAKECLTYFDTNEVDKTENANDVGPIEVMHQMLDELDAPKDSEEKSAYALLNRFNWFVAKFEQREKEIKEAKVADSRLYIEQSQKIFDLESRIAGLVNREKIASHAATYFETENNQLKTEIRAEIAHLLDKEALNAEANATLQKEVDRLNDLLEKNNNDLLIETQENLKLVNQNRYLTDLNKALSEALTSKEGQIESLKRDVDVAVRALEQKFQDATPYVLQNEALLLELQETSEKYVNAATAATRMLELGWDLLKEIQDWLDGPATTNGDSLLRTAMDKWAKETAIFNFSDLNKNAQEELQETKLNLQNVIDNLNNTIAIKETCNQLLQTQLSQAQNEILYLNGIK